MKKIRWGQRGLAAVVAASLLGLPQIAAAHDNNDRNVYNNGAYQSSYYRDYDRGYAYPPPPVNYRNYGYAGAGYRDNYYYGGDYGYYRSDRSPGKSAAIVGGSAAAGAIFGALAGGGKGAAIGAAVGGIGGLILDQATKDRHRY